MFCHLYDSASEPLPPRTTFCVSTSLSVSCPCARIFRNPTAPPPKLLSLSISICLSWRRILLTRPWPLVSVPYVVLGCLGQSPIPYSVQPGTCKYASYLRQNKYGLTVAKYFERQNRFHSTCVLVYNPPPPAYSLLSGLHLISLIMSDLREISNQFQEEKLAECLNRLGIYSSLFGFTFV